MKESDWKIFKLIKQKAIEKFCETALNDFSSVIENDQQHIHERYITLYRLVRERDKEMTKLFEGHSRSKAGFQLLFIRREGLCDEKLLQKLSEEFLNDTDPKRIELSAT